MASNRNTLKPPTPPRSRSNTLTSDPTAAAIHDPPTGPICCIFSDIPDSTAMWSESQTLTGSAHQVFYSKVRALALKFSGYEVKNLGDGFVLTFQSALLGLKFCLELQKVLATTIWDAEIVEFRAMKDMERGLPQFPMKGLTTRLGVHFGLPYESRVDPVSGPMDYHGNMVNVGARIMATAEGDEIAVSDTTIMELDDNRLAVRVGEDGLVLDRVKALERVLSDLGETQFEIVRGGMRYLKGVPSPYYITFIRLKRERWI